MISKSCKVRIQQILDCHIKKSGLLPIISQNFAERQGEIFEGFPIIKSYKYLGMTLTSNLCIKDHLASINRKIIYITMKLSKIRSLENTKININLFKLFIFPLYRLAFSVYKLGSFQVPKKFINHIKVRLKIFCRWPINTANKILYLVFGDFKSLILQSINKLEMKLLKYMGFSNHRFIEECSLSEQKLIEQKQQSLEPIKIKHFPRNLTLLVKCLYTSQCLEHQSELINSKHLYQKHNFQINVPEVIIMFQKQQGKSKARSIINSTIKLINIYKQLKTNIPGGKKGHKKNRKLRFD